MNTKRVATPNDPKLSDGGGRAADVPVGSAGLPHSGCPTGAVRWSAWLGDVVLHDIFASIGIDRMDGRSYPDESNEFALSKRINVILGNAHRNAKAACDILSRNVLRFVEVEFEYLKCFWIELVGLRCELIHLRFQLVVLRLKNFYLRAKLAKLLSKTGVFGKTFEDVVN